MTNKTIQNQFVSKQCANCQVLVVLEALRGRLDQAISNSVDFLDDLDAALCCDGEAAPDNDDEPDGSDELNAQPLQIGGVL